MELTVHDVGLGQCITLIHPSGKVYFWDCGSSERFNPADYCRTKGIREINRFTITNFDQDHISGLVDLNQTVQIRALQRSKKADADYIANLKRKSGPITDAMGLALQMHRDWNNPSPTEVSGDDLGMVSRGFSCSPSDDIADTNNLSLVTVLTCNGVRIVISGDIERKGWQRLIDTTDILDAVSGTSIFIASHHGRESGYHETVLGAANPSVVVMSDHEVKFATQESLGLYRKHCSGVDFGGERRRVLTTRTDGSITWKL